MTIYEYYRTISDLCYEISGIFKIQQEDDLQRFYYNCMKNYDKKIQELSIEKASRLIDEDRVKRLKKLQDFRDVKKEALSKVKVEA